MWIPREGYSHTFPYEDITLAREGYLPKIFWSFLPCVETESHLLRTLYAYHDLTYSQTPHVLHTEICDNSHGTWQGSKIYIFVSWTQSMVHTEGSAQPPTQTPVSWGLPWYWYAFSKADLNECEPKCSILQGVWECRITSWANQPCSGTCPTLDWTLRLEWTFSVWLECSCLS